MLGDLVGRNACAVKQTNVHTRVAPRHLKEGKLSASTREEKAAVAEYIDEHKAAVAECGLHLAEIRRHVVNPAGAIYVTSYGTWRKE